MQNSHWLWEEHPFILVNKFLLAEALVFQMIKGIYDKISEFLVIANLKVNNLK